jgi:hypothetical protein
MRYYSKSQFLASFPNARLTTLVKILGVTFTVIVNNMRDNVVVLPYDDHDRAIKLLHSLDHTMWSEKVEVILVSEKISD